MTRVIIYTRVSSEDQVKNYSLGTQRPECIAFAQAQGWTVVDTVTEAQTATNNDRPAFQRVLSRIEAGEADTLLVHTQDRFSRDMTDTLNDLRRLRRVGAGVWTVMGGQLKIETAIEQIMTVFGAFGGQKVIEDMRERAMRGQRGRADAGRLMGGRAPYGYRYPQEERYPDGRLQKWRLEENPETAPVVRRIFAEYLAGRSVRSIAAGLTLDGIPRPTEDGKAWNPAFVHKLLRKEAYIGRAYALGSVPTSEGSKGYGFDREKAVVLPEGTIPPLVTDEDWQRAQEAGRLNKEASPGTLDDEATLLRGGIIRCGRCGRAMKRSRSKRYGPGYQCNAASNPSNPCGKPSPNTLARFIDPKIWENATRLCLEPGMVRAELDRLREAKPDSGRLESLQTELARTTKALQTATRRMLLIADDEEATAIAESIVREQSARKRALDREIAATTGRHSVLSGLDAAVASFEAEMQAQSKRLSGMGYDEKRALLRRLGVRVRLYPEGSAFRWLMTAQPLGELALDGAFGTAQTVTAEMRAAQAAFEMEESGFRARVDDCWREQATLIGNATPDSGLAPVYSEAGRCGSSSTGTTDPGTRTGSPPNRRATSTVSL